MASDWGSHNLDQIREIIIKENDELLEQQVRGWAGLAELYTEQRLRLMEYRDALEKSWTSPGGREYLSQLGRVLTSLENGWEKADTNSKALDSIRGWIAATQSTIDSLKEEFEAKGGPLDAAHNETDEWHDIGWLGTDDDPVKREKVLEDSGINRRARDVMDLLSSEVGKEGRKISETFPSYDGPRDAAMPTASAPGAPGAPGAPSAPSAPVAPTAAAPPPPPAPPTTPTAPPPPTAPAPPGTTSAPPPPTAPVAPTAPPAPVAPVAPTAPGAPSAPGTPTRASVRPTAASSRPTTPSAPSTPTAPKAAAPGKPGASGKMAPPPAGMKPKGGSKPLQPTKPGTPLKNAGNAGKPGGTGKMAPPAGAGTKNPKRNPGTSAKPGNPMRPQAPPGTPAKPGANKGIAGKPGAVKGGQPRGTGGQFKAPPHIGAPRNPKRQSQQTGQGKLIPQEGMLGGPGAPRVSKPGASRPVLANRASRITPMSSSPRSLGLPSSMTPPGKPRRTKADTHGVIKPAKEEAKSVSITPFDPAEAARKRADRLKDPLVAGYMNELYKVAGLRSPVISTPAPPRPQVAGPVIGT